LWYRSRFPLLGAKQKAVPRNQPHVSFVATPRVKSNTPAQLEVAFRVDDAPAGARLELRLYKPGDAQVPDDQNWRDFAKRRHIGFDAGGEGGALLFEASIEDQRPVLSVARVIGPRKLKARLLDETGRIQLDAQEIDITLDDTPPSGMSLAHAARITRGTAEIMVRAAAAPQPSKIKEVAFIFGSNTDFDKAVAENRVFKARPEDPKGTDWSATLPVPKDAPAKLVITARFTTGVGLADFKSGEIAVIDPDPVATKPAAPKLGGIAGTVKVGDLAQPGLDVYLCDPMPAAKNPILGKATTDATGAFSFKDIEPKEYRLYCRKLDGILNRTFDQRVTVAPGDTVTLTVDLAK
jgi:hypothetical protein